MGADYVPGNMTIERLVKSGMTRSDIEFFSELVDCHIKIRLLEDRVGELEMNQCCEWCGGECVCDQ